ncbi:putative T7SS-secreted protein [Nocardia sp. NPDC006630]|uniref:putative T7SS-secreted protein n=1 Tax=Nocardia sp. NPDC006630 TaxID=3157181 RepID=UPI0033B8D78F
MGLGDFVDKIGDAIENGIDEVETKAGSIIDRGTYEVADLARDVGADSVASAIQDLGDQIADHQGGEVLERQLGQTKDKTELIRGEPSKIHDVADKLRTMSTSIESTGNALRTIDVADWTGKGAAAFHSAFDKQPKLWWTAGDAFSKAAAHLDNWYWAVVTGQAKAQEAIDKWEAADKEEKSQKDSWNALSDKDKKKTTLVDTWSPMRDAARDILKNARSQRDSIASTVVSGLQAQTQDAPTEPSFTARWTDNFEDLNGVYENGKNSFYAGVLTSFTSIAQFARSVDVLDPYNISHPAQYISSMSDLGTGMVVAAADPGATVGAMLSDARQNPFEAAGAITGNVVLTVATGGGGSAKIGVDALDELSNATKVTKATTSVLEDVPSAAPGRALPRGDAPVAPARTEPKPDRAGTPNESGAPSETRPNATKPDAPDAQAPKAGLPRPDGAAPGAAAPEGGGRAAAPHPDGAAPQANPVADARPNEVAPDSSSPGPHQEQPVAQPHPANEHAPDADSSAPRRDQDAPRSNPEKASQPDPDSSAPHNDRPADIAPARAENPIPEATPKLETTPPAFHEPGSAAPHGESPNTLRDSGGSGPHIEPDRNPAHPADPDGTHAGGHDASPEHGAPNHEQPAQVAHNPTLDERAVADQPAPEHARSGHPEDTSDLHDKTVTEDPVDIATGAFLLPETDLDLPGVLGLVLRRTHRSSYRFGRWFGPSWSATLDLRLIVDAEGVTFLGEDGLLLAFPHASAGVAVESTAGGHTLTRTETGGYQVQDTDRELTWHFAPESGLDGLDVQLGNFAISAITDQHHNRIRFHYDAGGAPVSVTHSGGYRVDIDTAGGRVIALTVVGADQTEIRTKVKGFDYQVGNLVAVTNAVGAVTRYTYDEHARMVSWTDSNANSMLNIYDNAGRVVAQHGTAGILSCSLDYLPFPDDTGTLTTVTDSLGSVTTHGFDRDLRLRDLVDPTGARTHIDYNAERRPLEVVAPDGATTRYRYTELGDVAQIIRPDGATITAEYARRNRPAAVTDADGSVRQQEWDGTGLLTATINTMGGRTDYVHHANGAVASIVGPTGARTTFDVDPAGLPVAVTDPNGGVTRTERDNFGRPVRVTNPLGAATHYVWAPNGKLLQRTDPDGHNESWTWDGEGNLLTQTTPTGAVTRFTYGAFDLMESRTDPDGSVTRYTWDTERRLTGVLNPLGQTWKYEYDRVGRLIAETDYSGAVNRYTHDRVGRVVTATNATEVTRRHTYDVLGRVTEIAADSGEWLRYSHNPAGRVLTATSGLGENPIHTLEYTYSASGQAVSQRLDDQPEMRFDYDEHGRRIRRTTPSGAVTNWQWDPASRARSMSVDGHHIDFSYDSIGRSTGWRVGELAVRHTLSGNGLVSAREITGFPASSLNLDTTAAIRPAPHVVRHDNYTYRPDGYLIRHTTNGSTRSGLQRDYTLDEVGRITAISHDDVLAEAYSYDPLSNIVTCNLANEIRPPGESGSATTEAQFDRTVATHTDSRADGYREYRNNLLIRDGRTRYRYDALGRLIRKTTTRISRKPDVWHYRYNAFHQLVDVWTPVGQHWHYTYDATGCRVGKQCLAADGTILDRTDYSWDGTYLVEQTTTDATTRWHYQPNSRTPITQSTGQNTVDRAFYVIVADLVGTPTDLIDSGTAEIVATASSNLWGVTSWKGKTDTPLRFPGQIHDRETGFHYNLH